MIRFIENIVGVGIDHIFFSFFKKKADIWIATLLGKKDMCHGLKKIKMVN
jgi:hypothetical protein